jgi:heat shock protein HslJ
MQKAGLTLLFCLAALPAEAQSPSHSSGFPVFTQFDLVSINGAAYGDRPRTLNMNLAGNGNPYAVGFAGCHGWVGTNLTLDREQIKFGSIDLTQGQPQGPCNPAQQKAEDDFLNALKQTNRWQLDQQTLILTWDGGTMRMAGPASATSARRAPVQELFEKMKLLGIFAQDCTKPPSGNNLYYVHRLIDPDHVQRDRISGPNTRDYVNIIDDASANGTNEISVKGKRREGSHQGEAVSELWRVDGDRLMTMEGTLGSVKGISNGKFNGATVPWINRCSS